MNFEIKFLRNISYKHICKNIVALPEETSEDLWNLPGVDVYFKLYKNLEKQAIWGRGFEKNISKRWIKSHNCEIYRIFIIWEV